MSVHLSSTITFRAFTVEPQTLYKDYTNLIDPETGRAREVCLLDLHKQPELAINDAKEGIQACLFYLQAAYKTCSYLKAGDLRFFEPIIRDHNCHVTASIAIEGFRSSAMQEEADRIVDFVKPKIALLKNQLNQLTGGGPLRRSILEKAQTPLDIVSDPDYVISISQTMKYLIYSLILSLGTECTEHPNRPMTLRINAQSIQQKLGFSVPLIQRLFPPFREYINGVSVNHIQQLARDVLNTHEADNLHNLTIGETPFGEKYPDPCAFLNMKATIVHMARQNIPFVIVKYNNKKIITHEPLLFVPRLPVDSPLPLMERASISTMASDSPVFVIQCFFNESLDIEQIGDHLMHSGLIKFILANVAMAPQFLRMERLPSYAQNEDIKDLPIEIREEIAQYRQEGKTLGIHTDSPAIGKITHAYADTFQHIGRGTPQLLSRTKTGEQQAFSREVV